MERQKQKHCCCRYGMPGELAGRGDGAPCCRRLHPAGNHLLVPLRQPLPCAPARLDPRHQQEPRRAGACEHTAPSGLDFTSSLAPCAGYAALPSPVDREKVLQHLSRPFPKPGCACATSASSQSTAWFISYSAFFHFLVLTLGERSIRSTGMVSASAQASEPWLWNGSSGQTLQDALV